MHGLGRPDVVRDPVPICRRYAGDDPRTIRRALPGRCEGPGFQARLLSVRKRRAPRGPGRGPGRRVIPARPVPSVRFPVSSVQLARTVDGAVLMVRRRSTVRFRNGAPGQRPDAPERSAWWGH